MAEKFRNVLRLSIVCFFVLAIFFFLGIFLLSIAHTHQSRNLVKDKVPIQQQELSTWGELPGDLMFNWTRSYMPYYFKGHPTREASLISMTAADEVTFNVTRKFENATWYPQKSVVSYDTNYTMTPIPNSDSANSVPSNNATYEMLNFGAYDVWYQMVNKPTYFKAWQAVTLAYKVIEGSNFINVMYGYNCLGFFFNNQDDVDQFVLLNLEKDDRKIVYNDATYGLGNVEGLTAWSAIAIESKKGDTSPEAIAIKKYFKTLHVNLDATTLKLICGDGSMLRQIILQVNYQIYKDEALELNLKNNLLGDTMGSQWGFSGVTTGPTNNMIGVTPYYSIADFNKTIPYAPEFGAFVLDPAKAGSTSENTLNATASGADFSMAIDLQKTFLNLESMHSFYIAYESNDMSLMSTRFAFTSWGQVKLFHDYLDELIMHFLQQDGEYQVVPLAQTMNKHMNNTLVFLTEALTLDVTSRLMASKIKASGNSCSYYFQQGQVPEEQADEACKGVDLTNVNTVKEFINATWFGSTSHYFTDWSTKYGLNPLQGYYFWIMDPTTAPTTFGSLYEETITEIATWYGCAETSTCDASFGAPTTCRNCTATELSALQWGSCGVTNNPKDDWDPTYLPKQYTVAQWGDNSEWLPFGDISEFIEYPQATSSIISGAQTIDLATAEKMASGSINEGSLTSHFAWMRFLIGYFKDDTAVIESYKNNYGFNDEELDTFIFNMRVYIQNRFFGGAYSKLTMDQVLFGYENDVAAKVNGGDYFFGDDFSLSNMTTPIITDQRGFGSNVSFGLYTGSNGDDEIGYLRIMNDVAYVNKKTEIWSGNMLVNVTQQDPLESLAVQELRQVSYGMQFPPEIENDDQLKVYDQRNMKVMTYSHSESQEIGANQLKLEKFTSESHGDRVGFAYNLPLFEKPQGCYQCYINDEAFKNVTVNEEPYTTSTSPSDNFIIVQPDSGYTYQVKRQSTIYMIVGGNQTVTEKLRKATPLPGLDTIFGHPFPFYEFKEDLLADESTFVAKFDYIAVIGQSMSSIVIAFSVLATLALILGIVAIVVYKMKDPKRRGQEEEHLVDAAGADLD